MKEAKFRAYIHEFVRNEYRTMADRHRLSAEELQEVLSYKNISEDFVCRNWYGSETPVVATVDKVELDRGDLIFYVSMDRDIPEHYIPCPFQIMKGKGLLFPVSVSRIENF